MQKDGMIKKKCIQEEILMKANQLIFQLILNISLQVMVASLLAKLKIVQDVILQERRSWKSQAFLAVIFGGMIILSTYTGIPV